jgi:transcriptional regulator with XRE-family HTH domain
MGTPTRDVPSRGTCLSRALKAIRRRRGLRPAEVAQAMGMPLRSYEYFESGRGRLNIERIHQVADVLDADPYALLVAMEIGSAAFAVRCADNKTMTILVMALQDFDAGAGDDITRLEAHALITAFTGLFDDLTRQARDRESFVAQWMADKGLAGPSAESED